MAAALVVGMLTGPVLAQTKSNLTASQAIAERADQTAAVEGVAAEVIHEINLGRDVARDLALLPKIGRRELALRNPLDFRSSC